MKLHRRGDRWWFASCVAFVLGCGQPGGETTAAETGESTAGSTGTTTSGSTTPGSSSADPTEGSGSVGQTETGTSTSASTTGEPPGTSSASSSGGETTGTSSGGETTGTSSGTTKGGDPCEGFEQPGCIEKGCPEGQKCNTEVDCVPSSCFCDPETGDIACTDDCGGGTCVGGVDCEPIMCDMVCEFGFKTDEKGCDICECKDPPPACGCVTDDECVKASPGCCSCNMGGTEVAVAKACIDQLEQCPLPPDEVVCPAVYKCTDAKAVCVKNQCVLQ